MKLFKEKKLYIVRGIPGCGKSTFAKSIAKPRQILEADQFFMEDGVYKFDPSKIKDAHLWCKQKFRRIMSHPGVRDLFYRTIVISNTSTQEWEMKFYANVAKRFGYKVFYVIVENRHGGINEHGVPEDKLELMKQRFQISL